ncbi:hypothetical protein [Streptomyces olivochromogenes]|uniref:hypothetical protein n=1 Tax=Streptomyces olivochromogenes TaxID=1963 RepID=UPI001F1AC60D|nr:hypothetical protein [Streptomyces olivochromogenes]MCF3136280.1 hypothetical protein [Streptomyces olivochromogenes]
MAVAFIGALAWILVAALRKVPAVCREATTAVRAVRKLRDEIKGPQKLEVMVPRSADKQRR